MNSINENPYWHQEDKPHVFDPVRVEELCLIAFEAFATSQALSRDFVDAEDGGSNLTHPLLIGKHRAKAEAKISSALLTLSITYRALEERLRHSEKFINFQKDNTDFFGQQLTWHKGKRQTQTSLRAACNKIIHAEDLRPTYESNEDSGDGDVWFMDGVFEMGGTSTGGDTWRVSIILPDFLEAMLDVAGFVETSDNEA